MRRREQAQMKLAQVQKLEAVGQLTAGIAHDFNNLLAVIRGGLEFIDGAAARGLTAEPELIDAALRATRRGSELVQRLLAFSRQSPLNAEPTAIDQLVLDTLRLLQRTLGAGVDIVTDLDATAAMVCVDRNQFANALVNLALNARDAMPEGANLPSRPRANPPGWAADEGAAALADRRGGLHRRQRHRRRHDRTGSQPRLRAVLHDQAGRPRQRPWAEHGARVRGAVRRAHRDRQRDRARYDHHDPSAEDRGGRARRRNSARRRRCGRRRARTRPCCWSRTIPTCGS